MSNYKEAVFLDVKFNTPKGVLSITQLPQLSLTDLSTSIKAVKKLLNKNEIDDELSFLDSSKVVDKIEQLRFEILKDVYLTIKSKQDDAASAAATRIHNQKILQLIAEKKEGVLQEKSIEELEKMIIQ